MKGFKEVEATRRSYHRDPRRNSVHRSSLTVPRLAGAEADISFVNHFRIKRGLENVACRITAVDAEGARIGSRLFAVAEPKVYTFRLSELADEEAATYLVEFFSADNLFIPFPAVMVNHRGPGFLNMVHAYNRILNDVFEDDAINAHRVAEASVDVRLEDGVDTFAVFTAGPQPCRGVVEAELATAAQGTHRAEFGLDVPRFGNRDISIKALFPAAADGGTGVLKLWQPRQFLFYGRMLAGARCEDGAFTANHSYYDSSGEAEYWDDERESFRTYPLFEGLAALVRMYPIMSPGRIALAIDAHGAGGRLLGTVDGGEVESPGARFIEIDVSASLANAGLLDGAEAFAVRARPAAGKAPTRVNHQIVYRAAGGGPLESSVNVSLKNPNIFVPSEKTGLAWGQVPVGGEVDSWLGFVSDGPARGEGELEVTFYGADGEIATRRWTLPAGGAVRIGSAELAADLGVAERDGGPDYLWYVARCARPELSAFTVSRHRRTGHCSGEHNF